MADLLFELGSEELPARFVVPALADLEKLFREGCQAQRIKHGEVKVFGTPRRLALLVSQVAEKTDDVVKEVQGPSVKAAFEADGRPKKPAEKFAESVKLPVEKLKRVQTPKGEYVGTAIVEPGRAAAEIVDPSVYALVEPYLLATLAGEETRFEFDYPGGPSFEVRTTPLQEEHGAATEILVIALAG